MRFRTTPKDFRLWIMDLHATVKRDHTMHPSIAKTLIKLEHDGVHAVATDRYIVVDSLLKAGSPEDYASDDWLGFTPALLSLQSWELLKSNASSVYAVEVTGKGLGVFLDQAAVHGDLLQDAAPSFVVEFSPDEGGNFPNLEQLLENAYENPREIDDTGRDGFRLDLVKHIKDVMVEPRSIGFGKPGFIHTKPPRVTGIIMPVRVEVEG